jgi:hypothetical protein
MIKAINGKAVELIVFAKQSSLYVCIVCLSNSRFLVVCHECLPISLRRSLVTATLMSLYWICFVFGCMNDCVGADTEWKRVYERSEQSQSKGFVVLANTQRASTVTITLADTLFSISRLLPLLFEWSALYRLSFPWLHVNRIFHFSDQTHNCSLHQWHQRKSTSPQRTRLPQTTFCSLWL